MRVRHKTSVRQTEKSNNVILVVITAVLHIFSRSIIVSNYCRLFMYLFNLNKMSVTLFLVNFALLFYQVNFSEGGTGSNSTGSEVASMSSQLPDTPNSMVSSPIEA